MSLSPSSPSSPTRTIKASQTNPLLALPTKHIAQIDPTVQLVVQALETTKNYVTEYPERIDEVWKETRKWIIDYRYGLDLELYTESSVTLTHST